MLALVFLLLSIIQCSCIMYYNNSIISPFRDIVLTDSLLYIGGAGGIVVLHRENVSQINVTREYSNNWLLLYNKKKEVLQCNQDATNASHCRTLTENLVDLHNVVVIMMVDITHLPTFAKVKVPFSDNDIVVIAATSLYVSNKTCEIFPLTTGNLTWLLTRSVSIKLGDQYDIVFKSTFMLNNASFVFYLFQLWKDGNFKSSKLGKLCLYKNISNTTTSNNYSYKDIKLVCLYNNDEFYKIEKGIVHTSYLIAVFTKNNTSIICLYDWLEVNTNLICNEAKGDYCNIFNETMNESMPLTKHAAYVVYDSITAISWTGTYIYSFLYIGTKKGLIGTVDFNQKAQKKLLSNFRSIDVTRVVKIQVEQDSLYVLTENKVEKVDFKDCSLFKNCQTCIESQNPYCGWDYSKNQCHSNETDLWWWLPSTAGFCIEINILSYKEIKEEQLELPFIVTAPDRIIEYSDNFTDILCKVNGVLYPDLPREKWFCKINLQSITHIVYTISIHVKEVKVTEHQVEFYKCDVFKTCIECTTRPYCHWSLENFTCISHYEDGIEQTQYCPRINTSDIVTKVSGMTNITISVNGFENLLFGIQDNNVICEVNSGSSMQHVSATYDGNLSLVTCLRVELLALNSTKTRYTIRLIYKDGYIDNETVLDVYTCEGLLGDKENSSECMALSKAGYSCGWCNCDSRCYNTELESCEICDPIILKILPTSGPSNGGTLLTLNGNYTGCIGNINVTIGGVSCTNVNITMPNATFTCKTSALGHNHTASVLVFINGKEFRNERSIFFRYQVPTLNNFAPQKGIVEGNTKIKLTGSYIEYEGPDRYNISFCNNILCLSCRKEDKNSIDKTSNLDEITCGTENTTEPKNMTRLEMTIDERTHLTVNKPFYYLSNPNIVFSNDTPSVLQSGGAKITINGVGFLNVGEVTVDKVDKRCDVRTDTTVICETPEFVPQTNHTPNEPVKQTVHVNFDGLRIDIDVNYVEDPSFEKFPGIYQYDKVSTIQIKGRNMLLGAKQEDYVIQIGLDGRCYKPDITMERITCYPPNNVPRTNYSDTNIVFVVVEVGRIKKYIGDLEYKVEVEILPIVVGVLGSAFVIVVVVGVTIILIMRKKRKKAKKQFKMELISREEMIRKASREEFADAQMTIRDIKTDLVTSRVPYCSYQTYICYQLFPNLDVGASALLQSMITNDNNTRTQSAMDKFDKLLTNKLFLKSLVQTLDRQNKLTVQEKAHLSSLLSIALLGNMRLYYDLINCLLSDMIETASTKQQKVLFRRFESITQRLVANWLQISMYEQLKSQSGLQLFLLYKAVQTVTEKAPIDAVTGNSKNTLAEEKLLKMRVEYEPLTLQIDLNGNSDQHFPVKVLDCDTISQVKRKCCLQIYKNKPISEIPDNDELTLEWHHGKAGKHTLNDIDNINERIDGLVRLNTLKHYMVEDNSTMALMYKDHEESDNPYANSATLRSESVSSDNINLLFPESNDSETLKWHLESCSVNLPDDVKSNIEHDIGDIFLNRLFHTKLLLTDYIDTTFEGLMDPQSLSLPVRYFLCMLDKLGKDADVDDDVLQAWKSECYATRMWAPLIGKPQIIFDVDVPNHVEPCMDILKHVFVESFTQTPHKVNKDSPPQKLLFHKDIPRYRKLINPFFMHVEPVTNQEFWSAMENLSEIQKRELKFSREATISQLYNLYVGKYKDEIISDFNEMTDSKDLGFANKLEEVIELVEDF